MRGAARGMAKQCPSMCPAAVAKARLAACPSSCMPLQTHVRPSTNTHLLPLPQVCDLNLAKAAAGLSSQLSSAGALNPRWLVSGGREHIAGVQSGDMWTYVGT